MFTSIVAQLLARPELILFIGAVHLSEGATVAVILVIDNVGGIKLKLMCRFKWGTLLQWQIYRGEGKQVRTPKLPPP